MAENVCTDCISPVLLFVPSVRRAIAECNKKALECSFVG